MEVKIDSTGQEFSQTRLISRAIRSVLPTVTIAYLVIVAGQVPTLIDIDTRMPLGDRYLDAIKKNIAQEVKNIIGHELSWTIFKCHLFWGSRMSYSKFVPKSQMSLVLALKDGGQIIVDISSFMPNFLTEAKIALVRENIAKIGV